MIPLLINVKVSGKGLGKQRLAEMLETDAHMERI